MVVSVVGSDLFLHALGLAPVRKGLAGMDVTGIPAPLGIPLPLWQQLVFFALGALVVVLAVRLWRGGPLRTELRWRRIRTSMRGAAR
jgi:hypothetical protein